MFAMTTTASMSVCTWERQPRLILTISSSPGASPDRSSAKARMATSLPQLSECGTWLLKKTSLFWMTRLFLSSGTSERSISNSPPSLSVDHPIAMKSEEAPVLAHLESTGEHLNFESTGASHSTWICARIEPPEFEGNFPMSLQQPQVSPDPGLFSMQYFAFQRPPRAAHSAWLEHCSEADRPQNLSPILSTMSMGLVDATHFPRRG
mmetsp:Transcript_122340/g.273189  ORF Transcript_122340/g.273189 Transcript_122340/m.273189 type:complete len:207 (+) Transcript_122340:449-1069(+)